MAILVLGEVDGTERAPSNLLLYQILVDTVLCRTVIFAVAVLGAGIESFLVAVRAGDTLMMQLGSREVLLPRLKPRTGSLSACISFRRALP